MKSHHAIGIGIAALIATATVAAPAAYAAPKKPGLYGPTQVTAGQEVTYTSVFIAAPKKNGCFAPTFTFSDTGQETGIWGCISFSDGPPSKSKPKVETDTQTHVFTEPGTYTVTTQAGGLSNGGGIPSPKKAIVKGPRTFTLTVTVAPAASEVAP